MQLWLAGLSSQIHIFRLFILVNKIIFLIESERVFAIQMFMVLRSHILRVNNIYAVLLRCPCSFTGKKTCSSVLGPNYLLNWPLLVSQFTCRMNLLQLNVNCPYVSTQLCLPQYLKQLISWRANEMTRFGLDMLQSLSSSLKISVA